MKRFYWTLLSAACVSAMALSAQAQTSVAPDRSSTRTVVVPLTAGGAGDKLGRMLAQELSAQTGRNYIVDNRPGAGGNIAASHVARSPNDGSVILLTTGAMLTINPHLFKSMPFDPLKDFTFIAKWVDSPNILFVNTNNPVKNFDEFLAWVKANSGKLNFGSAGIGTSQHLSAELFKQRAGVDFTHAPYKGGAQATSDLAGGVLDFTFSTVAGLRLMEAGKLRPLAVTSMQRLKNLPDVPTLDEAGLPNFEAVAWYGVVGPAGMDPAEVTLVQKALERLNADPAVAKEFESQALVINYKNHIDGEQYTRNDYEHWKNVIEKAGIQKN